MFHTMDGRSLKSGLTVVYLLLAHCCAGQSQVPGPPQPIVAVVGYDVILPCHLEPPVDAIAMTLEWERADLSPSFVHVRRLSQDNLTQQHPSYAGRTSMSTDDLKQGNVSLRLSTVKLSDEGKYTCFIPSMEKESTVQLLVVDVFVVQSSSRLHITIGVVVVILCLIAAFFAVWKLRQNKTSKSKTGSPDEEKGKNHSSEENKKLLKNTEANVQVKREGTALQLQMDEEKRKDQQPAEGDGHQEGGKLVIPNQRVMDREEHREQAGAGVEAKQDQGKRENESTGEESLRPCSDETEPRRNQPEMGKQPEENSVKADPVKISEAEEEEKMKSMNAQTTQPAERETPEVLREEQENLSEGPERKEGDQKHSGEAGSRQEGREDEAGKDGEEVEGEEEEKESEIQADEGTGDKTDAEIQREAGDKDAGVRSCQVM